MLSENSIASGPEARELRLAAYQETLHTILEPIRDVDPHNPFIMATVDPAVIGEHSDIFNKEFVGFLSNFISSYANQRNQCRAKEGLIAATP